MSSKILNQNFTPKIYPKILPQKNQLIKKCTETNLLIDGKYISQATSFTAQKSSRRAKSPKTCKNFCLIVKNVIYSI